MAKRSMGVQSAPQTYTERQKTALAMHAMDMVMWHWFLGTDGTPVPRPVAGLLFLLYLALKSGKKLSKTEACEMMRVEAGTTGLKYIAELEKSGLITIERKPPEDRRKDFLIPTEKLADVVEKQLGKHGDNLRQVMGIFLLDALPRNGAPNVALSEDQEGTVIKDPNPFYAYWLDRIGVQIEPQQLEIARRLGSKVEPMEHGRSKKK